MQQTYLDDSRPLLSLLSFYWHNLQNKSVDFSGTRTRIVGAEIEHSDHLTPTTIHTYKILTAVGMEIVSRRRWRQYWPKWKLLYLWQIEKKLCRTSTGPFHTYMFDYLADPLVWRTLTFFVRGNITVWLTSCLTSQDLAKQANLFIVLTQQKSWIQTSQTGGQPYISPYKVSECSLTCSSPSTKELHVVGVCPLPSPRSYLRGRTLSRLNVRLKGIEEQSLTIVCRHHRDTGVRAATR